MLVQALGCWITAGALKGDYRWDRVYAEDAMLSLQPGYSVFVGIREAAFTWLLFVPLVLAADASLVSHGGMVRAPSRSFCFSRINLNGAPVTLALVHR